jgi:hypothetical protein
MSFKVKVYYSNKKNGSIRKLTFHRVIRELKTGRPGIHYKNKAYPVFPFKEGDIESVFFNINASTVDLEKSRDCRTVTPIEAKDMLENLAPLKDQSSSSDFIQETKTNIAANTSEDISEHGKPETFYTDLINLKYLTRTGESKDYLAMPVLKYHELNLPAFNQDWFIERTKWYVYVLVNNYQIEYRDAFGEYDGIYSDRLGFISRALDKPQDFKLANSAYFHLDDFDHMDLFTRDSDKGEEWSHPGLTIFKELLSDKPVEIAQHKTLDKKWGEIDFEERDSVRPSVNGATYDHWFRFDLSYSNNELKDLFNDIFSIYSMELYMPNILSTSNPFAMLEESFFPPNIYLNPPHISIPEPELDAKAYLDELEIENEIFANQNKSLKKGIEDVTLDYMEAQEKIEKLKERINVYKDREKKQISKIVDNFLNPEIYIPRKSLKILENDFSSRSSAYKILNLLIKKKRSVKFKNANAAEGWKEVDKKISTGKDEQGRMYVGEIKQQDTKFVVLIGHKKNQSKDYEYMKNNHPSKMIEDK